MTENQNFTSLMNSKFILKFKYHKWYCIIVRCSFRYVNKFTEFLLSFVKNHLRRFENDARFLILEFLSLLFKYTFDQPRTNQYLECLEIWMVCLEYIGGTLKTRSTPEGHIIVSRYREALNALVVEVLSHVEFRRYQQNLEELDDENLDDNVSFFFFLLFISEHSIF